MKLLKSLSAFLIGVALAGSAAALTTSTINPGIPAQGSPISSAPLRQNFVSAYNDINNLYALINAGIENNPPGGTIGQLQYNGGSGTFFGVTMGGDCTFNYSNGVITCTKSNGVTLGTFAALIPTGSSVPANGVYLPLTNAVGFASNGTYAGLIDPSQRLIWAGTANQILGSAGVNPYFQLQGNNDDTSTAAAYRYSADAFSPSISFAKSRSGTRGTQTVVQSADELGKIRFYGSDGTNFQQAAAIRSFADAAPSSGIVPGRISWFTANTIGTLTEGLRQDRFQHLESLGAAPTCGTGCASVFTGSTDVRGYFVTSSAVTSATLDFANTYDSAPFCTISDSSTATVVDISNISTTVLTVSFAASVTGIKVYYHCIE